MSSACRGPTDVLPLDGITVVALEQAVAAPFATRQLADLGARVIKVERPGVGDLARGYDGAVRGLSSYFVWLNRSKESLTLNLKNPRAVEILGRLILGADVVIQNLRPGVAQSLGFDSETLVARRPALIACDITGYGTDGSLAGRKAYDLLIQCEVGLASITGSPNEPSKTGISIADIAAGMYAFSGILAALYRKERTGRGGALSVSLFDALGEWMGAPGYFTAYGGREPERTGPRHATIAPYGPYGTRDSRQVFLAVQTEDEWQRFCTEVLDRPEMAKDPRFAGNASRVAHRTSLECEIASEVARIDEDELERRLDRARIARGSLRSVQDFWSHPQLRERKKWRAVQTSVGEIDALVPPISLQGAEPRMDRIPDVGQDTLAILRELGYTAGEIAEMRATGAI